MTPQEVALKAIEDLKDAVRQVIANGPAQGMRNSEIGKALNIYEGYRGGQHGHLSRTILERLKEEETVQELPNNRWILRSDKK